MLGSIEKRQQVKKYCQNNNNEITVVIKKWRKIDTHLKRERDRESESIIFTEKLIVIITVNEFIEESVSAVMSTVQTQNIGKLYKKRLKQIYEKISNKIYFWAKKILLWYLCDYLTLYILSKQNGRNNYS